jgi:uncharacterized protein involved in outer membrane biogenesis
MTPNFGKRTQPSGTHLQVEVGKRWRPGKWTWGGLVLVLLVVSYIVAGFYLAPRLIRSEATAWVKTNLNKPLALGEIKFNPLTFTLDVSDLAIPADAKPILSIGHLRVGFSILSLFQHAYYFREVRLDRPFVRAVLRPDHSLNLTELEPRTHTGGSSKAVRIGVLSVAQGEIVYADDSQPQRPETTLTPVAFALTDFQTNRLRAAPSPSLPRASVAKDLHAQEIFPSLRSPHKGASLSPGCKAPRSSNSAANTCRSP